MMLINVKNNNKYIISERIGNGSFAVVYKGINLQTNDYVAIKQIFSRTFIN